ncbi:hypothetical protein AB0909_00580 [Streptomyces albidoflavus]|uniref:hypothetical protein n=1 Tax=Streptomyces albidoflavus TaxID=1886 RepID=UPI00340491F4
MTELMLENAAPPLPSPEERPAIAAMLRAAPGRWALIGQQDDARALRQVKYSLRRGLSGWTAFGPGFETAVARFGSENRLYVRFAGGSDA